MNDEVFFALLVVRGAIYLAIGVMMLVISTAHDFVDHRWAMRFFAIFFLILSANGILGLLANFTFQQLILGIIVTPYILILLWICARWIIWRK